MKPLGSIAALVAAIGDDAAAEADGLTAAAAEAVSRITSDAESCPLPIEDDRRVVAAARDRARVRVSQEDWNDARDAVAGREEWIQRVLAAGVTQLQQPPPAAEARAALAALAREAISRLPAGAIDLAVTAADAPLLDDEWRASVSPSGQPRDIRIVVEPIDGGCVARSADGRASFDNTYGTRIERLQAQWRGALSDIYERITSQISLEPKAGA